MLQMLSTVLRCLKVAVIRFVADDGPALAGHLAFVGLLSVFPFMIFSVTLAGLFGASEIGTYMIAFIFENVPEYFGEDVLVAIAEVFQEERGGLMTISLIGTVWIAASGIEGIRIAVNRALGMPGRRRRPLWWRRLQSAALVVLFAVVIMVAEAGLVFGPLLWELAESYLGDKAPLSWPVGAMQIVVGSATLFAIVCTLYQFLPNTRPRWHATWPGAVAAMVLWAVAAYGFSIYVTSFSNFTAIYGSLGGIVLTLLLFYLLAAIFIFGAEINGAIALELTPEKDSERG